MRSYYLFITCFLFISTDSSLTQAAELIPREALFSNPKHQNPQLSPDGKRLAYLSPHDNGNQAIWVREFKSHRSNPVTPKNMHHIKHYFWLDATNLGYLQDNQGDENQHVWKIDINTGTLTDLTPFQGVKAVNPIVTKASLLVGLNRRTPQVFDMYRIDIQTGSIRLDTQNPGDVIHLLGNEWIADHNGVIRAHRAFNMQDGSGVIRVRDSEKDPWRTLMHIPPGNIEDGIVSFAPGGQSLYVLSSIENDTNKLLEIDLSSKKILKIIDNDKRCNLWAHNLLVHPTQHHIQAVLHDYLKPVWHILDPNLEKDFKLLNTPGEGTLKIISRDRKDSIWIVAYERPDKPTAYYQYDKKHQNKQFLFFDRPELTATTMASMKPLVIQARDGLKLPCYLTLPVGVEASNLPMVLYVHGGPTARDHWKFDPFVQMLANRGYAVLQVNFRGSVGYGKKYRLAGNGTIGVGAMQHDLTDAVKWAINNQIADAKRIAITGSSYGGYATLAGLAFTPDLYACGVESVGPSNIGSFLKSIPPYWGPLKNLIVEIFGDAENNADYNRAVSPIFHVDKIKAPLLIAQGKNDPRCPQQESDRMVQALRKAGRKVDYIVYTNEGHSLSRSENRLDYFARVDEFLAGCLKGKTEKHLPIPNTSAQVK